MGQRAALNAERGTRTGRLTPTARQCAPLSPHPSPLVTRHSLLTPHPSPLVTRHSLLTPHHSSLVTRSGISLLEVLIATLCLSVGLMGLIALIPLGHHDVVEATKMDRGGTLGRASFRDVQVRGYLRPDMWCDSAGNTPMLWGTPPDAFVIDPLLCGYAANGGSFPATFPYGTPLPTGTPPPPAIKRVSIRATYNATSLPGSWAPMNYSMADRVCRLGDDLAFVKPDDAKLPPAMSYQYDKAGTKRMARQFEGNYCWLVTLAPAVTEMATATSSGFIAPPPVSWTLSNTAAWTTRQYKVSVAICYKRNLGDYITPAAVPAERMVNVAVSSGLGGGEVQLTVPSGGTKDWLEKLKPNQWIMLSAKVPYVDANGNSAMRTWLDWYRITAVDDGADLSNTPNAQRYVTLHGPDWTLPTSISVYATIVDGVVGVYQKTITLDGTSSWRQ